MENCLDSIANGNNNKVDTCLEYETNINNYIKLYNNSEKKKIMIDDDSIVPYEGSVYGRLCRSLMPRKGWKNYIYGKYRIFSYLNEREDKDETVS